MLPFRFSVREGEVGFKGPGPTEQISPGPSGGERVIRRLAVGGGVPAGRGGVFEPEEREALGRGRLGDAWKRGDNRGESITLSSATSLRRETFCKPPPPLPDTLTDQGAILIRNFGSTVQSSCKGGPFQTLSGPSRLYRGYHDGERVHAAVVAADSIIPIRLSVVPRGLLMNSYKLHLFQTKSPHGNLQKNFKESTVSRWGLGGRGALIERYCLYQRNQHL